MFRTTLNDGIVGKRFHKPSHVNETYRVSIGIVTSIAMKEQHNTALHWLSHRRTAPVTVLVNYFHRRHAQFGSVCRSVDGEVSQVPGRNYPARQGSDIASG